MTAAIPYQQTRLHYSLQGNGPAVVLLHGFGETAAVWDDTVSALKNDFQILVPDIPGSGQTGTIADMSMEGLADALKALTDELGWASFVLIGHSMGGYISLAFAAKNPDSLRGLGLFHSTAFADSEEKVAARKKGMEFIRTHGPREFLKNTIPNLFAPDTREKKPELLARLMALGDNFSGEALVSYYESMIRRPDRSNLLSKLSIPVLIVMGEHDQAVPLADALRLCKLPKIAYIHTLTKSGHMGMWEEPGRSHQLLRAFLEDC